MIDRLERRRLLANAFIDNDGVLNIEGDAGVNDTLSVSVSGSNFRFETGSDSQDFPMFLIGALKLSGLSGDDHLIMSADVTIPVTVNGGDGNDIIEGGGARGLFFGDDGNDHITSSSTKHTEMLGGLGNDTLEGGSGKDNLLGGEGDDVLLGNGGRDTLNGNFGFNTLSGGTKNDTLLSGFGSDFLVGSAGLLDFVSYTGLEGAVQISMDGVKNDGPIGLDNIADSCECFVGGSDSDFIRGSGRANIIDGGEGNDTLIGGSGNDTITGGFGNDSMEGQSGKDLLISRDSELFSNADTVNGGSGSDTADADGADVLSNVP